VERAIEFGLAVNGAIAPRSIFARKNYFYPDLPKGYQISQFEIPVVQGGSVEFFLDGEKKSVRLVRAHLEEDAGKSLHEDFIGQRHRPEPRRHAAAGDRDRARHARQRRGRGLRERAAQDRHLDRHLRRQHAGGQLPLRRQRVGAQAGPALGTRREIKNLNSFKFMQQAIDYEVRWQIEQIEDGHAIQQATVLFDPDTGETRAMRTKEDAADYRYFPDPDLPPLVIALNGWSETRGQMAELPRVMAARFVADYGLPEYDATTLTQSKAHGRLLRGGGPGLRPTQAGQQLGHGRGVPSPECAGYWHRRRASQPGTTRCSDHAHCRQHRVQQRRAPGVRRAVVA
jgi:aspartyl-tRNA(Asn)/glutamyl-tRNA(Gln) amidotransferase subunit B